MEHLRYVAVLRRHLLVIAILTAFGAGAAAFVAVRQPKFYSATATILINPAAPNPAIAYLRPSDNNSTSSLQQLASTYDAYLHSNSFATLVIHQLSLTQSPAALSAQIHTDLVGSTNFFHISVRARNPQLARFMANGIAGYFIKYNPTAQPSAGDGSPASSDTTKQMAYLRTQIDRAQSLDAEMSKDAHPTANQLIALNANAGRLNSLMQAYNDLLARNNSSNQSGVSTAKLIDEAQLPTVPTTPSLSQTVIFGTIAGLAVGLMVAFFLDYLDYSVRSPEDVETATGQMPLAVISIIGSREGRAGRRRGKEKVPSTAPAHPMPGDSSPVYASQQHNGNGASVLALPELSTVQHPQSAVSEAFRTLRTNLAFSTLNQPARTLMVTSVLPSEGKSTIAANLAVVLAQSGKRVILVDCDLRRPSVHRLFHVPNRNGFTDLLLNTGDLITSLQETGIPNLRVLPSGTLPPNPAELLTSEAVVPLIEKLVAQADTVLFDSPPMGVLTDAVVLSTRVEGTLMVVRAGSSRPNVVANGIEAMRKVGGRPLGAVLNMVDVSSLRDYSYYYYYAQTGYYDPAAKGKQPSLLGS